MERSESSDFIGRYRATLVFNARVKSRTAIAGSICQRLASLDVDRRNRWNSQRILIHFEFGYKDGDSNPWGI